MKLSSLKDLKVIKKDLEPEPEAKPSGNQPRSRIVVLRSKEEEKTSPDRGGCSGSRHGGSARYKINGCVCEWC